MTASLITLVLATLVLVTIPGPNVALIVATSLRHGIGIGVISVLGTTLGVALQLAVVVVGMAAVVEAAASALTWIKWAGVVYLFWLGVSTWRRAPGRDDVTDAAPAVFWRGAMIAALNPKTLLFNAAFLPQFLPADASNTAILLIGVVYLSVILVGDLLWALSAGFARRWLGAAARLRNRIAGGFLMSAGVGLALSRRFD